MARAAVIVTTATPSPSGSDLSALFSPRSVAVVGASADPHRIGGRPIAYLRTFGYGGRVYPVNPRYEAIDGDVCYPSVAAIPEVPHLAIVSVGGASVLKVLTECAELGVAAAIVFAAGFSESGPEGEARQREVRDLAARSGMRILGPNTLGLRNHGNGLFATFATDIDSGTISGNTAVIAQSGGLGGYVGVALPRELGAGTKYFIDTGNEADIDVAECVEYLTGDPTVSVLALLVEGCRDGRRLVRACAEATRQGKLVVAMKVGTSQRGAEAALSHTGALAGEDRAWSAAFRAAGAVRVDDESVLADIVALTEIGRPGVGPRLGIVTLSGGVAVSMLDTCERLGLCVPPIAAFTPPNSSLPISGNNPIDASGGLANEPEALEALLTHVIEDPNVDVAVIFLAYMLQSPTLGPTVAASVTRVARTSAKPMYVCGLAGPAERRALTQAGVPVLFSPTTLLHALSACVHAPTPSATCDVEVAGVAAPDRSVSYAVLTGDRARALLPGVAFLPATPVTSLADAMRATESVGWPVVVKAEPDGVAHKTELGLVLTGVATRDALSAALADIRRVLAGGDMHADVVVQRQIEGIECFIGFQSDPVFGPMVVFGIGGILVEYLNEVSVLLAPTTSDEALAALRRQRTFLLLQGPRGTRKADVQALAELVAQVSSACLSIPDLVSVDLNPVIVGTTGQGVSIVDMVAITRREAPA